MAEADDIISLHKFGLLRYTSVIFIELTGLDEIFQLLAQV